MKSVAVVDYGMGNLDSVARAVEECGGQPSVTGDPRALERADRIILPGVGAFADGMRQITERGLVEALEEQVLDRGIPFLGLCLGMQLLATEGEEGGRTKGLGWIEGDVRRLRPDAPGVRIPHVGWNEVELRRPSALLEGIESGRDFYFVHSYHLVCARESDLIATTPYCGRIASVIGRDHIFGVQFHPEKSQRAGFRLLTNFLAL